MMPNTKVFTRHHRIVVAAILPLLVLLLRVEASPAGELIPSLGWANPVEDDAETKVFPGIAVRGNLLPLLKSEVGIAYRSESRFDDQLDVRMIPLTASLYVAPAPMLYAGGGVGWYYTTLDYDSSLPFEDETSQEFGVHVGGGMEVPLGPNVGVDLNGRYVMMRELDNRLVPEDFDPDFWMTTLGLAIKF
jgi:hypothetical protein